MAFSLEEFRELVRILEEQPEWRAELRRLVLAEDLLDLPRSVQALVEAQRRTEEQVAALVEAQRRTEEQVAALVEAQRRTDERLSGFEGDMGDLKGYFLEARYRSRPYAYFGSILRRAESLTDRALFDLLEKAVQRGELLEEEMEEVALSDVVARGNRREDRVPAFLVAEVSWGIGPGDVMRAARRASLLTKTGMPAIPVVAGKWVTPEAAREAKRARVWLVTDGRSLHPEEI